KAGAGRGGVERAVINGRAVGSGPAEDARPEERAVAKVVLEGVVKKFGPVTAVDDLTIEIADREFVTLVGPSGCGKTTTLRMIAGLEKVTAGQIYFDDDPVGHLPADHRDIAMVFQS